ncbi:MAG: hypothetical protein NW223_05390 [Hyphomicrobiaceae bacterium]|nr:hypothetical protein [Hyphomicrobiaceae bacterium]
MPNLTFRIMSAGAAAFFGGLCIGWIVLGKPFSTTERAVAATMRAELPRPGRIPFHGDEPAADPAGRETAPSAPDTRIAQPKPLEARPTAPKPEPAKPAEVKPAEVKPAPATPPPPAAGVKMPPDATPEVFPTRRLKKLADRARVRGLLAGLMDPDEDDDDD